MNAQIYIQKAVLFGNVSSVEGCSFHPVFKENHPPDRTSYGLNNTSYSRHIHIIVEVRLLKTYPHLAVLSFDGGLRRVCV